MRWEQYTADGSLKSLDPGVQILVPAARVYKTAEQTFTTSVAAAVTFDAEYFDTDGIHDLAANTNRLTCRTAGKYFLHGAFRWASNATGAREISLRLNGVTYLGITDGPGSAQVVSQEVSAMYDLAVGDYIELVGFQSSGGDLAIQVVGSASPFCEMIYLGPGLVGTSGGRPQWVTTLPTSALHGDEVYLIVDATNGISWHLKYNAYSASAYKWEYLGGPPMRSVVDTSEGTASTTYVDLTTAGPSITVLRAGDYEVQWGASLSNGTAAQYSLATPKWGAGATADADGAIFVSTGAGQEAAIMRQIAKSLAALDAVKIQYRASGGTSTFRYRWLRVTPVRVS